MSEPGSSYHSGIIFADIKGFSKIRSTLIRRELHGWFQRYRDTFLNEKNHFTSKLDGDKIVVFTKNATEGASLALHLRDHFRSFDWQKFDSDPHGLRIGTHFALIEAVEKERAVLDFLGQEIDTGARLEPVTTPGKAFCTAAMHSALLAARYPSVVSKPVGVMAFAKGYGKAPVYELMWATEAEAHTQMAGVQPERAPKPTSKAKPKERGRATRATATKTLAPGKTLNRGRGTFSMAGALDYMDIIKQMLCWNQGNVISHFYIAGERHKEFRCSVDRLVKEHGDDSASWPISGKEKARTLLNDLEEYLNSHMELALVRNFEYAEKVFQLSKGEGCLPRFSFKYHRLDPGTQRVRVESYQVGERVRYRDTFPCVVRENTASQIVEDEGSYYLSNNIPEAAKKKLYKNPRLDPDKAALYAARNQAFRPGVPLGDRWDERWISCWRPWQDFELGGAIVPPVAESCYKSTLVVPCTLKNNKDMDHDFWGRLTRKAAQSELFKLKKRVRNSDIQRQIYAYFCMDYPQIEYFDKELDVRTGYVFADVLSLYFFVYLTYTSYSGTVRHFLDVCGDKST